MKTVTEFPGVVLRQIDQKKKDLLSSGTTEEQLPEALTAAFKIEGDRLMHLMRALTQSGERLPRVSRVRVFSIEDETKAPQGAQKEGDHFYLIEQINAPEKKPSRDDDRKGGRDKKGGKRSKGRDGGGRSGERSGGPGQGPARGPSAAGRERSGPPGLIPMVTGNAPAPLPKPITASAPQSSSNDSAEVQNPAAAASEESAS